MVRGRIGKYLGFFCAVAWAVALFAATAEYQGQVTFNGLPVPGATVTAIQDSKEFAAITDAQGLYSFRNLTYGRWTIEVRMTGFATLTME
jgi:hypothetical protein